MLDKRPESDDAMAGERPLECSECRKPIGVRYTEIVASHMNEIFMCADCPQLQKKLHGAGGQAVEGQIESGLGLVCGHCGTTLESLRISNLVGCGVCYEVFDDIIAEELAASHHIPSRFLTLRKASPLHSGKIPGEAQTVNPSLRLLALNEALSETLKREDYEQAAWLRDQIKALTEHQGHGYGDG